MNMFETKLSVAFAASLAVAAILPVFAEGEESEPTETIEQPEPQQLTTVEATDTIQIHLFDYDWGLINQNGLDGYFNFRGNHVGGGPSNADTDADGFGPNRALVLPKLDADGYPVFDGRGKCDNASLGYLFGASLNANGEPVKGVTEYVPENLPLVYEETTGYYKYHSVSNACDYDANSNRLVIWDYTEVTTLNSFTTCDFLPFNTWDRKTFDKNNRPLIDPAKFWFGYRMDAQFIMPPGGVRGGEDVVFSFSGDDDVWVFIDGVLVVDLGGTHGMCTGTINFKTGEVTAHMDWQGAQTPSYPTSLTNQFAKAGINPHGGWSDDGKTFADYSTHEMKIFYLERGGTVSNMNLEFNLQPLPPGTITVTKSVKPATVEKTGYEFTLHVETNGVQWVADTSAADWPTNASLDTDNNDVKFTLNAGGGETDKIDFTGIPRGAVVTITESDFAGMADFYGCYLFSTNDWRNGRTATFTNDYVGCVFSFVNGYYDLDCISDLWICDHDTPSQDSGKTRLAVAPDLDVGVDAEGWMRSITNRYAFGLVNLDTRRFWGAKDVRLVGVENGVVWLETDFANVSNAHTKAVIYKK